MKLGFVSAILPDLSLEDVVGFAAVEDFSCVELMCWPAGKAERRYAGVTHVSVDKPTDDEMSRVRDVMADSGVAISALGYYPNVLSPDAAEAKACRAHLKKVIAGAAKLGVGVVNTFVGRDWAKSVEANWPAFRKVWPSMIRYAEDRGVTVCIENCPMLFTADEWPGGKNLATTPAIWRRMFEEIPSDHFGLNYDPSHLVWQGIDYIAPLREFAGRIHHVHAKDVRVDRDRLNEVGIMATPLEYSNPKLPGLGEVNWGRFFSVLGDVGYDGAVCIEVEDRCYEGSLTKRTAALRQAAGYLRNFLPASECEDE